MEYCIYYYIIVEATGIIPRKICFGIFKGIILNRLNHFIVYNSFIFLQYVNVCYNGLLLNFNLLNKTDKFSCMRPSGAFSIF